MPQKTIYVKEEDQELFEKASRLGGDNLSSVIAEALRRFVASQELAADGMGEVMLEVGPEDDLRKVRFVGRVLAEYDPDRPGMKEHITVYLSQRGRLLVYDQVTPLGDIFIVEGDMRRRVGPSGSYEIYGSLEDLGKDRKLPGKLVKMVEEILGQEFAERLEI